MKYDLAIKTGEYTNSAGEKKNRYINVGVMMEKDGKPYILLDRTFNPAGVPNPDNKERVLISLYEQKGKSDTAPTSAPKAAADMDSEIPF